MGNSNKVEKNQMNVNQTTQEINQFIIVDKNSINEMCRILKFNQTNSLLFIGCETKIKIYAFHNGILHKLIELYHTNVTFLYLKGKKDIILISGCDKKIMMRSLFGISNNKVLRKIIANDHNFSCIAISEQNHLLVAGLYLHIYFFCEKNCEWILIQDLLPINIIGWVYSLNFNESQNKLISCYDDNIIAIIQSNQVQQWEIVQIIRVDNFVKEAIFFGNDSFIFHPWMSKNMFVYKFKEQIEAFTLSNTFLMEREGLYGQNFTSLYIKQRLLLIKQDNNQICLFQVNNNQELQLFQKIKFYDTNIRGTMSNDGLWLIIWDEYSKKLNVISCFQN